jgi:hypothetical protein
VCPRHGYVSVRSCRLNVNEGGSTANRHADRNQFKPALATPVAAVGSPRSLAPAASRQATRLRGPPGRPELESRPRASGNPRAITAGQGSAETGLPGNYRPNSATGPPTRAIASRDSSSRSVGTFMPLVYSS